MRKGLAKWKTAYTKQYQPMRVNDIAWFNEDLGLINVFLRGPKISVRFYSIS